MLALAIAVAAGTGRDTMVNGSKARVCAPQRAQVRREASWPRQKSYIRLDATFNNDDSSSSRSEDRDGYFRQWQYEDTIGR